MAKETREATPSSQWAQRTVLDAVNVFVQTGLDSNPTKGGDVSIPLWQVKGIAGGQAHASVQCHPNPDRPPRQQLTGHLPAGSITILTSQSSAGSPAGGPGVQSPGPTAALGAPRGFGSRHWFQRPHAGLPSPPLPSPWELHGHCL